MGQDHQIVLFLFCPLQEEGSGKPLKSSGRELQLHGSVEIRAVFEATLLFDLRRSAFYRPTPQYGRRIPQSPFSLDGGIRGYKLKKGSSFSLIP